MHDPANENRVTTAWSRNRSDAVWLMLYLTCAAIVAALASYRTIDDTNRLLALRTMAIGVCCGASCALVGCYLVLRKMSLLGDAISHSVLPGIAIAYFLTGQVTGWPLLAGAMVVGVLTSFLTQTIHWIGRVAEDASMGVVYTTLFAVGVIMMQTWAPRAHLDADCVLYGQIDYAAADLASLAGYDIPRSLSLLVPVLGVVLLLVVILWKQLKVTAFDPAHATAMGIPTAAIHYILMAAVAVVCVASFESVGSILVVAMLIVPAATAQLIADRLVWMMVWATAISCVSAVLGTLVAFSLDTTVAGVIAVVSGLQFAIAVFIAPRQGLASKWLRNLSLAIRIRTEDFLAKLYRHEETPLTSPMATTTSLLDHIAVYVAWRRDLIARGARGVWKLTDSGLESAQRVVRAHRLWEAYLDTHFDLPRDHLHEPAEYMEHYLSEPLQQEIDAELAGRSIDPHGKQIPALAPRKPAESASEIRDNQKR
ncbi:ABC-3 protein [Pirellula staleyi DSM 6068]|uniref:ABC-3 protein n=1 Tax=Pirellula staleyi (strain ATCC 27377 / DSM 6068 / ICPB 4128) TaxID=530564 RepID=D2R7Y8_PIRSD|nr:metal ABC transporter permease [Pirellula staleyi]ADB19319.1 ABC-3 protein [Pirellula staleyi DSM 6068]